MTPTVPPQFVLYSVEREVQRTILKLGELTKRLHTKWQDFQVFFPIRSENLAARTCPQKNNGEITSRETDQTKKNPANVSSERGWGAVLVQSHSLVSLCQLLPLRQRESTQGWSRKGACSLMFASQSYQHTTAVTAGSSSSCWSQTVVLSHSQHEPITPPQTPTFGSSPAQRSCSSSLGPLQKQILLFNNPKPSLGSPALVMEIDASRTFWFCGLYFLLFLLFLNLDTWLTILCIK